MQEPVTQTKAQNRRLVLDHNHALLSICRERKVGERRWVLLKIPRCDIDGVGEGK